MFFPLLIDFWMCVDHLWFQEGDGRGSNKVKHTDPGKKRLVLARRWGSLQRSLRLPAAATTSDELAGYVADWVAPGDVWHISSG